MSTFGFDGDRAAKRLLEQNSKEVIEEGASEESILKQLKGVGLDADDVQFEKGRSVLRLIIRFRLLSKEMAALTKTGFDKVESKNDTFVFTYKA